MADGVKKRCPSSQRSGWLIRLGYSLSRLTQAACVGTYSIQGRRVLTVEIDRLSCCVNNKRAGRWPKSSMIPQFETQWLGSVCSCELYELKVGRRRGTKYFVAYGARIRYQVCEFGTACMYVRLQLTYIHVHGGSSSCPCMAHYLAWVACKVGDWLEASETPYVGEEKRH